MSKRIKGITIVIDGQTQSLQNALKAVNNDLSKTNTALRDVNNLLKFNPGNAELLRQKQIYLKQAIEETKGKLDQLNAAMKQMQSEGNTSENQEQQRALAREIVATESKLKDLERQSRQAASVLGSQMQAAGEKLKTVGSKITGVGRTLSMYVTAPIAGVGAAAVKTTSDFDSAMSQVRAISGATGQDFDKLREKAREMGATTKFTASESAEALNYMAMAGWKTEEMLEGLDGILSLAAAGGTDLGRTSDIVTDALTAFGQSAAESGRLADIMAAAAANANTNVDMMGETFKYAAPVAGSLGMTMEDTAVAIGLMANSGIKASMAGTTLRTGLTNLVKPTKQMAAYMEQYGIEVSNSDGSMKSLREIMILLRSNLGDLAESEQAAAAAAIFGKRAMSGWLAVINSTDEDFQKLTNAIDNSNGAAKEMSEIMLDNLGGQMTILKSQLQEVAISLGDSMVPMLRKGVEKIQDLVDKFNNLDDATKENIVKFGLFVAAIGPVLTGIGLMTSGIGSIVGALGKGISAIAGFTQGLTGIVGLSGPIGIALGAIVAGVVVVKRGLSEYEDQLHSANREVYDAIEASEDCRKAMEGAGKAMEDTFDKAEESIYHATAAAEEAGRMVSHLEDLYSANRMTNTEMQEAAAIVQNLNALYPDLNAEVDEYGRLTNYTTQELKNFIDASMHMAEVEAYEQAVAEAMGELTEAIKAKVDARANEKHLMEELEKAQEELTAAEEKAKQITEESIDVNMQGVTVDMLQTQAIGDKRKVVNDLTAELEANREAQGELDSQIQEANEHVNSTKDVIAELTEEYGLNEQQQKTLAEQLGATTEEMDEFSETAEETGETLEELALTAQEAYDAMYSDCLESVTKQIGLFDEMSMEYEGSIDEMIAAQESQIMAMQNYYDNLEKIWNYVVQTGDEAAMDYVQSLADMGTNGAGYVAELAASIDGDTAKINRSIALATQKSEIETGKAADILTKIKTRTIETTDGIVYAIDSSGDDIVSSVGTTSQKAEDSWSTSMDNVSSKADTAMGSAKKAVEGGMEDARSAISNASGTIDSASADTFDKVEARAIITATRVDFQAKRTVSAYSDAIANGYGNVSAAAESIANAVEAPLSGISGRARNWGAELGYHFGNGIYDTANYVASAASYLASTAAAYLHFSTPDKGALKESDKWGGELADLFAKGMMGGVNEVRKAAETLSGAAVLQAPVGAGVNYNNYGDTSGAGKVINLDVTVNPSQGMDERLLADYVIDRINTEIEQEVAVFA